MSYLNKKSLIIIFGSVIVFLFLTAIPYFVNLRINFCGTPNEWRDFATYIAGISSLLTVLATISITYLVYKWSEEAHRSEYYFEKIIEHYIELHKNHETLLSCEDDKEIVTVSKTKIKIHVLLLRYYLHRYPNLKHSIKEFDLALNHIWFEPMNIEYYKQLSYEFETFCFYANNDQKRILKPIKDKKGNVVDVDY